MPQPPPTNPNPSEAAMTDPQLRRQLDHARTVEVLTRLGYRTPHPHELADVAWLRRDTLARRANPAARQFLAEALHRLHSWSTR